MTLKFLFINSHNRTISGKSNPPTQEEMKNTFYATDPEFFRVIDQ